MFLWSSSVPGQHRGRWSNLKWETLPQSVLSCWAFLLVLVFSKYFLSSRLFQLCGLGNICILATWLLAVSSQLNLIIAGERERGGYSQHRVLGYTVTCPFKWRTIITDLSPSLTRRRGMFTIQTSDLQGAALTNDIFYINRSFPQKLKFSLKFDEKHLKVTFDGQIVYFWVN